MQREYTEAPLDGGENPPKRITVKYIGSPCPSVGVGARRGQIELLQALCDSPQLMDCGLVPFQTLSMSHNGESWTVSLVARVQPQ